MYSLFCSQEQEIYVSNLVHLWSSYVRQGGGLVCTLTAREKPPKPLDRAFTPLARAYVLFVV